MPRTLRTLKRDRQVLEQNRCQKALGLMVLPHPGRLHFMGPSIARVPISNKALDKIVPISYYFSARGTERSGAYPASPPRR